MTSTGSLKFSFLCGIRGYHEYRFIWVPTLNEILHVELEPSNLHDGYAIAMKKKLPGFLSESVVGHIPREVSRITHFIVVHGGRVSCRVADVHHRRSPLVQGGLEIPAEITVEMDLNEDNILAMKKYESLVQEYYKEPVDGKFEDATDDILESIKSDNDEEDASETDSDHDEDNSELAAPNSDLDS